MTVPSCTPSGRTHNPAPDAVIRDPNRPKKDPTDPYGLMNVPGETFMSSHFGNGSPIAFLYNVLLSLKEWVREAFCRWSGNMILLLWRSFWSELFLFL